MLKILVTGATGFIGKKVALRLKALGHTVIVQGRDSKKCQELRKLGFEAIEASDQTMTKKVCQNRDVVVNCAGLTKIFARAADYHLANVNMVEKLIAGCIENNAKLVHISSPAVYLNFQDRRLISEDEKLPKTSASDYAQSKRLTDTLIVEGQKEGLRSIILRPHLVTGPEDFHILYSIIKAHEQGPLPLFRQGQSLVDLTDIDNVVDAIVLAVESDKGVGKIFNITNGDPKKVIELIEELFRLVDVPLKTVSIPFSFEMASCILGFVEKCCHGLQYLGWDPELFYTRSSLSLFAKDFTLGLSKAESELGYKPRRTTNESMKNFAMWYKEQSDKKIEPSSTESKPQPTKWVSGKQLFFSTVVAGAVAGVTYALASGGPSTMFRK